MTYNKVWRVGYNAAWQVMPSLGSMFLSLLIARIYGVEQWAEVVKLLVISQVITAIASWGNKDFLQREWARLPAGFNNVFARHFVNRSLVLFVVVCTVLWLRLAPGFSIPLAMMCLGRFVKDSFDALFLINAKQKQAFWIEVAVFSLQLIGLLVLTALEKLNALHGIVLIISIGFLLRGALSWAMFASSVRWVKPKLKLMIDSGYFALLSISGMIGSRIDLIVATAVLTDTALGTYQIVMSFLWNIQAISKYVLNPFTHHYYRLGVIEKNRIRTRLFFAGVITSTVGVPMAFLIMNHYSAIVLQYSLLIPSVIFAIQAYLNLPWIIETLKLDAQRWVLWQNIIGIVVLSSCLLIYSNIDRVTLSLMLWVIAVYEAAMTLGRFIVLKWLSSKMNSLENSRAA